MCKLLNMDKKLILLPILVLSNLCTTLCMQPEKKTITEWFLKIFMEKFNEKEPEIKQLEKSSPEIEAKQATPTEETSQDQTKLDIIFSEKDFREQIIDGWRYCFHFVDDKKNNYIMFGKHLDTGKKRRYIVSKDVCMFYHNIYDDELMR